MLPADTFPTIFMPITPADGRAMVAGYWHKKEQRLLSADDEELLTALEGNIATTLAGFGAGSEGVFAKLSSRSPKDSQFSMDRGVNTVIQKLESVKAASGTEAVDDNAVAVSDAWLAASMHTLHPPACGCCADSRLIDRTV
jgi:hypothetical protein